MNSITSLYPGDFNTGSLRDILFVPVNQVDQIKAPVDGILPFDALQFDGSAAVLYSLNFTEDTAECSFEQAQSAPGSLFRCRISASVPKDYQFRPLDFSSLDNLRFFVITRDSNNRSRLHGYINPQGEKYGMRLSVDFSTSRQRAGYNGYKVEFFLDSPLRPMPIADPAGLPINPPTGPGVETDPNPPPID